MKIWLINHYAVPPRYYPLDRPSMLAKNLIRMGHEVTIIAASTVHNAKAVNLIEDGGKVSRIIDEGIPYVLINCRTYQGNGIRRIRNILEFASRLPHILDNLHKPDAIVATSFDPFTCFAGIRYARKHGIKAVAEIADLWPETLVAYNGISPYNPVIQVLRRLEKKIYTQSDAIVFTMEGAYDYIVEQKWTGQVPRSKVHFINNGIDLERFDANRAQYQVIDDDLLSSELFKVVYVGSIRKVNNVGRLLEVAKAVKNPKVVFLIWGDGDESSQMRDRINKEYISNVHMKGRVEKRFIPYITGEADLNIIHNDPSPLFRFGISFNKMFDYLAAGKPILTDFPCNYNPATEGGAGMAVQEASPQKIAERIDEISYLPIERRKALGLNARKTAQNYDFKLLTVKLMEVIEGI